MKKCQRSWSFLRGKNYLVWWVFEGRWKWQGLGYRRPFQIPQFTHPQPIRVKGEVMASWFVPSFPPRVPLEAWTICGIGIANDQVACLERMLFKYVYNCLKLKLGFPRWTSPVESVDTSLEVASSPFLINDTPRKRTMRGGLGFYDCNHQQSNKASILLWPSSRSIWHASVLQSLGTASTSVAVPCCTACICMPHSFSISKTVTQELHLLEPFIPHV